ncbi:hypothetical protein PAXINDRAFT_102675 [Paxillus involutus ATCC 200175]|uniref:Uncharacterized protein n=1 Tax=Paxillus involutus ATCC 200175 TaxID=664439 RepID=A0A0C9TJQ3_PAXIN|nr:hypothetical protein PAXINDRAFT_102675 [Paxillus involutus ATCC 200175]
MDDNLLQRLRFAETHFLSVLADGQETLTSYDQSWSALLDDLSTASLSGTASDETLSLAHLVAFRISKIASCFLDVTHEQEASTAQLHNDWDTIFQQMDVLDLNSQVVSLHPNGDLPCRAKTGIPPSDSSFPPFLASAYRWLLDNLHNPYPTPAVKAQLAATSSCQIASINSWFISVRRRMGWTALCRDCFSNCRADIIDAAYRALVKEDPHRRLSPEVIHSFMEMKVAAEGLYSSSFSRSALAGDLDAVVKDMTEEDKKIVEDEKCRRVEEAKLAKSRDKEMRRGQRAFTRELCKSIPDSYPSPDRSRTSSPVPALDESLTDESEVEEGVFPPVVAGRKRRSSSVEPANEPFFTIASRPVKRLRSGASVASSPAFQTCLPSPPSSVNSAEDSSDNDSPASAIHTPSAAPPTTQNHTHTTVSRRRRLSDADPCGLPKRPRGSITGPRLHAVSDPLPRSQAESEYSVDEWFNTNFDALFALPPPVDAAEPDISAQWEVELFSDYSIPQDLQKRTSKSLSPAQDSQTPASTDLAMLESLLQSIESGGFVAPSETVISTSVPFITSLADSTCHDVSLSSDPPPSIDWTTLLYSTEPFEPTIDSIFPQQSYTDCQPLPEIDLSILQLPQVTSQTTSSGDLVSKQAKLTQLQALQEAVRQMQKELQSEGVVL